MQTFEERLTAWIDDRLPAEEHAAFERELAQHPDGSAFHAEKRHVSQLRSLLRDHLQAPPLVGADFFNHGILERIRMEVQPGERDEDTRQPATTTAWGRFWASAFGGGLTPARMLAAGAACLLAAAVGISALIPAGPTAGGNTGFTAKTPPAPTGTQIAAVEPPPAPPVAPASGAGSKDDGRFALNNRPAPDPLPTTPAPAVAPPSPVPTNAPAATTSATLLHFDEQNADVLWLDGLDYLPEVNGGVPAADTSSKQP